MTNPMNDAEMLAKLEEALNYDDSLLNDERMCGTSYRLISEVIDSLRVRVEAEKIDHSICPKCSANVTCEKDGDDVWLECECGWQSEDFWLRDAIIAAIKDKDHA